MKQYDFEDGIFYPRVLRRHVFSFYERSAAEQAEEPKPPTPSPVTAQ